MICRLCGDRTNTRMQLRSTPIANLFPEAPYMGTKYPLELDECESCLHVQIGHSVPDDELYGEHYKYQTPAEQAPELDVLAKQLKATYAADSVLEIGCNNGLFLQSLRKAGFVTVEGIDPSASPDIAYPKPFNLETAGIFQNVDLIVARNVFAHISDLDDVFQGIASILAPTGTVVFEVQYFLDMAYRGEWDMIYHEHRDYHTITPLIPFLDRYGLGIVEVERIPAHGGSIRVHCQRGKSIPVAELTVDWDMFRERVAESVLDIQRHVKQAKSPVVLMGAAAKACTLIHQCHLEDSIDYAVDCTPSKIGRYIAGTGIKVISEDSFGSSKSMKTVLLGAWNYEDIFRRRYPQHDFIVPFKPRQRLAA